MRRVAVTLMGALLVALMVCSCGAEEPRGHPAEQLAQARLQAARLALAEIARIAYPLWALQHDGQDCPQTLEELEPYLSSPRKLTDPWGSTLHLACGDRPGGAERFGVVSAGPDRTPGTNDDLHSWDEQTMRAAQAGRGSVQPAPVP